MNITPHILYLGVNDRDIDLFEGQYRVPNGICYNSYLIRDEKIAVMDTVDRRFTKEWLANLSAALEGRRPDYLIIQHMEPDHSAGIADFLACYPETAIVANAKTFAMMNQFFGELSAKTVTVKDGDTLSLGGRTLSFLFAPMVHWPEVMVTYDGTDKVLFSADGFGKFGALDAEENWADEARRYYIGIVGKYGAQVQSLLKKAATLTVEKICPLHGPVLTENLGYYLGLYDAWSSYRPENEGVCLAYASVYGNTEKAAKLLVDQLQENGCPAVALYDLSRCDPAQAIADAFRYSTLVLASLTYNADVFPSMHQFLHGLTERNYQNRTVGFIENGSWAPMAIKIMKDALAKSKNITYLESAVTVRSAVNSSNKEEIAAMAKEICLRMKNNG